MSFARSVLKSFICGRICLLIVILLLINRVSRKKAKRGNAERSSRGGKDLAFPGDIAEARVLQERLDWVELRTQVDLPSVLWGIRVEIPLPARAFYKI